MDILTIRRAQLRQLRAAGHDGQSPLYKAFFAYYVRALRDFDTIVEYRGTEYNPFVVQ